MSFDLNPAPVFTATVNISIPGKPSRPLVLRFKHKNTEDFRAFVVRPQEDREMVREIVDGVADKGADSTDDQFLDSLLANFPSAAKDIYLTYCKELGESRAKN